MGQEGPDLSLSDYPLGEITFFPSVSNRTAIAFIVTSIYLCLVPTTTYKSLTYSIGYILFLIIVVSLVGLLVESILVHGLIKKKYDNFR